MVTPSLTRTFCANIEGFVRRGVVDVASGFYMAGFSVMGVIVSEWKPFQQSEALSGMGWCRATEIFLEQTKDCRATKCVDS